MKLSLVIPVMNEQDNIKPLIDEVSLALKDIDHEIIFVDDGSSDQTIPNIKQYATQNIKLIAFNRNFGQTTAMSAGIDVANGELIATIDGDLQNDPKDIPLMIQKLEDESWDVVAGVRVKRQDGMFLRKIPSRIANWIIRRSTGVYISDYGCTLKLFKKDVAKNLELYGELHRFIPVLAKLYGAKMTQMDVSHHPRIHGTSKYGIGRTFRVISDLMLMLFFLKYRQKPMHLFGGLGAGMFGVGVLINFYLLILKLFGENIGTRPLLTLGMILIIGGIQFILTGFIAEMLMRTHYQSQDKKPYVIKEEFSGKK